MKFLIRLTTGLILAWGSPKALHWALTWNDPPETPSDYPGPKFKTYKFGVEQ